MAAPNSFGSIEGRNVLAANQFHGTTINIGDLKDSPQRPQACRAIHFPRNDDFVQRTAISAQIERLLPTRTDYQSAALWGLGGSGKTQLALEYAYGRCGSDSSCSVFWVHADTETSFAQDYKWIATKLGLADDLDGDKLLTAVRAAIEGLPQWVMVLDNADDLSLFGVRRNSRPGCDSATDGAGGHVSDGTTNLFAYVPRGTTGTVLWTSRDQQIVGSCVGPGRGINVVRMTDAEAESLFQAMSVLEIREGDREHDNLVRLLAELGWLPLAISQAAAYIRRTKTSVGEYVERIQQRKKRRKILKKSEHDRHRRPEVSNSVLETWDISMEYIRRENRMAYDILTVLAYVDSQNIPFAIIAKIAEMQDDERRDSSNEEISSPSPISRGRSESNNRDSRDSDDDSNDSGNDSENDDDDVIEALVRLEEFSFITLRAVQTSRKSYSDRVYDMHRLVQEAISYHLHIQDAKSQMEARSARIAFKMTDVLFPKQWQRQSWDWCEQMLGHAQRAGEWARLRNKGEDVADFLSRVSDYLYDRGRWRERGMVDMAMTTLRERILGKMHPDTLSARGRLGVSYHEQGRYKESEKIQVEVLSLRREILGDKHPDTISSMADLATTYHVQGRYEESEKIKMEALSLRREILGDKHPDTISSMADLAATYHQQGRYEESEKIKVEALSLRREILGDKHPDTIKSMADLAATYHQQGRYEESEKIKVEALSLRREILGDKHPDTIWSMASLAATYFGQMRYADAERIEVEIPKLRQQVLGRKHPATLQSMANLADIYYAQARYQEAEEIYVEVVQLRREVLGEQHLDTIRSVVDLEASRRALEALLETNGNTGSNMGSDIETCGVSVAGLSLE